MAAPLAFLSLSANGVAADPACRTAFDEPEFAFAAGCLVRHGDRMLLVRHRHNGKLGFPAGFARPGESAQCVAHRETWEESGVDVVVHGLIAHVGPGVALYHCEPVGTEVPGAPVVPDSGRSEISEVLWLNPRSTRPGEWRFPRDYRLIIKLFDQPER